MWMKYVYNAWSTSLNSSDAKIHYDDNDDDDDDDDDVNYPVKVNNT